MYQTQISITYMYIDNNGMTIYHMITLLLLLIHYTLWNIFVCKHGTATTKCWRLALRYN